MLEKPGVSDPMAILWRSAGFAVHSCRELVVAFGRPGVRLPEKPTSGLQYSCSDQEFRLFVLTTAAPIDREEEGVSEHFCGIRRAVRRLRIIDPEPPILYYTYTLIYIYIYIYIYI